MFAWRVDGNVAVETRGMRTVYGILLLGDT